MKMKFAPNCELKAAVVVAGLIFSTTVYASEGLSDSAAFLKDVSENAITLHCDDQAFLDLSGLEQPNCPKILTGYAKHCDEFIFPLVPAVSGTQEDIHNPEKLRSLGELYSLCLRALAYEAKLGE